MSWLTQYFLNPAFVLPGIALASVPIIIHIFSRLRYRTVRFAAMEFLLQSDELNRRRLILEQLLLLMLRVLAVVLITLLLARLVLDPSRLLLLRGASVHHVVILDDSLSMRERTDENMLFDKARSTLEQMLGQSGSLPGSTRLTLLAASEPDRPVIADRAIDQSALPDILARLRNLSCSRRTISPLRAIRMAHDILAADAGVSPQVHVLTDLRTADWVSQPELVTAFEALHAISADVNLVQVSDSSRPNVAITDLRTATTSVAVGVPWRVELVLKNFSSQQSEPLRAGVVVDGAPLPGNILIPPIAAASEQVVSHDITFSTSGRHRVQVTLQDDVLPDDNVRYVAVEVADRRNVLIVDDQGQQQDAGYVAAALAADSSLTGLAADIRTSQALLQDNLDGYDCLYLLNIRDLPADATQRLRQYVASGGGIVWFPDDQANVSWYSETLGAQPLPLFPVTLTTVQDADSGPDGQQFQTPVFEQHPIFVVYNAPDSPFARSVLISRWFGIADSSQADTETADLAVRELARLQNGQAIIFEHIVGKGKVLTFLTGAGRRWSNWPVTPAAPGYVVMHLLIHQYLQRPSESLETRELAETLRLTWPVEQFGNEVEVFLPDSGEAAEDNGSDTFLRLMATPVSADPPDRPPQAGAGTPSGTPVQEEGTGEQFAVAIPQADRPGIYRVRRFDTEGNSHETWLAMNIAQGESDLRLPDPAQLEPLTSIAGVRLLDAAAASSLGGTDAGRELRWVLLLGIIGVLIAEQLLSLKTSYHPEGRP